MSDPRKRKGSVLHTVKTVLWGFLGVRRNSDFQKDVARINPMHLLVVGVALGFLFVGGLMLLVHWIVP